MLELFLGPVQSMCPSHKTENLKSCGFLRSVYRYMRDFLAENLSFLSHLPLTHSPSSGKNELSSERFLADNLMTVQSLKRHPGEVFSEAFQTFLKERIPLSTWGLSEQSTKCISNEEASSPMNVNTPRTFYKSTSWDSGVWLYICAMEKDLTEWSWGHVCPSYTHIHWIQAALLYHVSGLTVTFITEQWSSPTEVLPSPSCINWEPPILHKVHLDSNVQVNCSWV